MAEKQTISYYTFPLRKTHLLIKSPSKLESNCSELKNTVAGASVPVLDEQKWGHCQDLYTSSLSKDISMVRLDHRPAPWLQEIAGNQTVALGRSTLEVNLSLSSSRPLFLFSSPRESYRWLQRAPLKSQGHDRNAAIP